MKKIIKAAYKKVKSNSGESIGEVLVSLLIASLALMILAGMITAAGNLIDKSTDKIKAYVAEENTLVEKGDGNSVGTGKVTVSVGKLTDSSTVDSENKIDVTYYKNDEIGGREVISYKVN